MQSPNSNLRLKAVIPAAGFGTRTLPATKAVPKELLPVLDRPAIQYVVEEAAAAGATHVLLITSRHKHAIEDHFDHDSELHRRLVESGRENLLASLQSLASNVTIQSVRQPQMRGLGDAVLHARAFCGDQPFLCMLGDAIFSGPQPPAVQLAAAHAQYKTPILGLELVPPEKVDRYGIIAGTEISPGVFCVEQVVEKPKPAGAPSRLAIAARYVLTPEIFDLLEHASLGHGGEIQLTDAINKMLKTHPVHGVVLSARRHDIGDMTDWLIANLFFAAQDKTRWPRIEEAIRSLK